MLMFFREGELLHIVVKMPGLLDLPIELRNRVYEYLFCEQLEPRPRGVMVVSEDFVQKHLPFLCYRGLLRACRQLRYEVKEAIRHKSVTNQINYELDLAFSHGRPYFSLIWRKFPGLSPIINSITVNVDLHLREPFAFAGPGVTVPDDHELVHLIFEDGNENFSRHSFHYIDALLRSLVRLMSQGDPGFRLLYTEAITLNLRRPTHTVYEQLAAGAVPLGYGVGASEPRRVVVDPIEAEIMDNTMRNALKESVKAFKAFPAYKVDSLNPLIQIGSLRFATEGAIWGEGHNLILRKSKASSSVPYPPTDDEPKPLGFQWLQYGGGFEHRFVK